VPIYWAVQFYHVEVSRWTPLVWYVMLHIPALDIRSFRSCNGGPGCDLGTVGQDGMKHTCGTTAVEKRDRQGKVVKVCLLISVLSFSLHSLHSLVRNIVLLFGPSNLQFKSTGRLQWNAQDVSTWSNCSTVVLHLLLGHVSH
jgi:hypothetical protein